MQALLIGCIQASLWRTPEIGPTVTKIVGQIPENAGAAGGDRTLDLSLTKGVLYH
jgi:hypothetical protein